MDNHNDSQSTLTVREAAALIGCHPQTVRKYIKQGKLQAHKAHGVRGPEWRIHTQSAESLAATLHRKPQHPDPAHREMLSRLARLEQLITDRLPALPPPKKRRWRWPWQRPDEET